MAVCRYCQAQCEDWPRHRLNCPPYKVIRILGKGRGLVATRRINVGEVVLEETPLMVIEGHQRQFQLSHEEFRRNFDKLDSQHQSRILELYDPTMDQVLKYSVTKLFLTVRNKETSSCIFIIPW